MKSKPVAISGKQQLFCYTCIALPAVAFTLGVYTIDHPILVLTIGVLAALALWSTMLHLVTGDRVQLDDQAATAATLALVSVIYGFLGGLIIGREGSVNLGALLVAFVLGLSSGMLYRKRAQNLGVMALPPQSTAAALA